jgi:hypothetical protein
MGLHAISKRCTKTIKLHGVTPKVMVFFKQYVNYYH